MKIMAYIFTAAFAALMLAGCNTTTITETSYAADGVTVTSVKETKTSESAIVVLAKEATKTNLAIKQGGWFANVGVNASTNSYGLNGGSIDNSAILTQDSQYGNGFVAALPASWEAQKYSIEVTKDGIIAEGNNNETTSNSGSTATSATEEK